jgi:hypothetical protein
MQTTRPYSPDAAGIAQAQSAPRAEPTRATGALVAGLFLFSASYASSAYVGIRSTRTADRILAVPAAGPWIDLAGRAACVPPQTPIKLPFDPCLPETAMRVALVVAGIFEDGGTLLTILGIPSYSHAIDPEQRGRGDVSGPKIAIVPTLSGAAAVGTF